VVVSLSCSSGRGRRYRTEEDRRETRRKQAMQRDPRRSWLGTGGPETRRSGLVSVGQESRRSSITIARKLFEESLSTRDNRIFRELIKNRNKFDELDTMAENINKNEEDILNSNIISSDDIHDETTVDTKTGDLDNKSQKEGQEVDNLSTNVNLEISGETPYKLGKKTKAGGAVVTINGRKAVIKKRKRGEISNMKVSKIKDRQLDVESEHNNIIRVQHKTGRQYRVKKRRRQEGVTRRQQSDRNKNTTDMQQQKTSSNNQNQSIKMVTKQNNSVLPGFDSGSTIQFSFLTPDLANADFAQFDSKFGGLLPPQATTPSISQSYTHTNTIRSPHFLHNKPSPSPRTSWKLFKDHPAKGINMDTGAYSFTVSL